MCLNTRGVFQAGPEEQAVILELLEQSTFQVYYLELRPGSPGGDTLALRDRNGTELPPPTLLELDFTPSLGMCRCRLTVGTNKLHTHVVRLLDGPATTRPT